MNGKIIIVGATGYTGSALAKSLKKENIDCHLIGRNEAELQKLANCGLIGLGDGAKCLRNGII